MKADIVLRSRAIFSGQSKEPFNGSVAITGRNILAVSKNDGSEYIDSHTQIFDLGDKLICPGFTDVHCFFTGYLLTIAGMDLSHCNTEKEVVKALQASMEEKNTDTLLARGLRPEFSGLSKEFLDETFGAIPVILFHSDGEGCFMNTAALDRYQFTPESCFSESYWRLLQFVLTDTSFSVPALKDYLAFMNSRGITSVKEMGFDDFWGFTEELDKLEQSGELTARISFMSQPVGAPMNLTYGQAMRKKFTGSHVHFSGYNQMTDGSISQLEGEMKQPYLCEDTCCVKEIDWDTLERDALAADHENFRFSLHAQGDRAIEKTIAIFDKCSKKEDGTLKNRHAITDLECSDPKDLERMGQFGIIAEVYPQIMSIANRKDKLAMIEEKIGMERGKNYWNRRKMADSGVIISCATDLPLLFDDIPESIYHSVGARFPEGGETFNAENTLLLHELLRAWTIGGQYNLGFEEQLGTLEAGKLADIAVLDCNLFETPLNEVREAKVCLTLVDGRIVYNTL